MPQNSGLQDKRKTKNIYILIKSNLIASHA